jgi:DNA polymerase I-like protein with 3'-5' exonuclease and polymerase domains
MEKKFKKGDAVILREQKQPISYQCHDEWLGNSENREKTEEVVKKAIKQVNEELKLNIEIKCSISFGNNYYECH